MLLNSHILAYATCFAGKVCGLVRSTWGTSQGGDKLGARDKILNTKVERRACAGQTFPRCTPIYHDACVAFNAYQLSYTVIVPFLRIWGTFASQPSPLGGGGAAKTIKRPPRSNQHNPQYANYWAPLTRKQHHKEHRPQRPSESIDPMQHAKGRTGDCPRNCNPTECHTGGDAERGTTLGLEGTSTASTPQVCKHGTRIRVAFVQ